MWTCLTHALRPTRSLPSRSGKVVFWEPWSYFPILGDIKPNFGPFLENFCYVLRYGLGNKTFFLPKIYSKWARNNCFWEFLAHFWTIFWIFLLIFAHFWQKIGIFQHIFSPFFIFRNSLGITNSFRPILAHFWNLFFNSLGNKTLFLPNVYSKWTANNGFGSILRKF